MSHYSYNEYHLGDNLIHLHFLRHLARRYPKRGFVHVVHECHREQLEPVIADVLNVALIGVRSEPEFKAAIAAGTVGRNVWKNAGDYWARHPRKHRYAEFYLEWFRLLASEMGLESPFTVPADLRFDYPALGRVTPAVAKISSDLFENDGIHFDFLIVNSQPCSGQFRAFDSLDYLNPLIEELAARYRVITTAPVKRVSPAGPAGPLPAAIPCTQDYGLTLTEIGTLSMGCPYLLMIATGPCWPTFNTGNDRTVKLRLLLLDCGEELDDIAPNTVHCNSRQLAREILQERKLL